MKRRIAAICAIVAFATCGGRAPGELPGCAHISTEAQGECEAGNFEVYIVNDRTDGQVKVTIHTAVLDGVPGASGASTYLPGLTTSVDRVLTLAAGERQKLGCLLFAPQVRYTWTLVGCEPL